MSGKTIKISTHGTAGGYTQGCREDCCRPFHAQYQREARKINVERIKADPSLAEHGLVATFTNWGCECRPCRDACNAYDRERNNKTLETATKYRQPWTSEDLELALDRDFSAFDLAVALGRTMNAIESIRKRHDRLVAQYA